MLKGYARLALHIADRLQDHPYRAFGLVLAFQIGFFVTGIVSAPSARDVLQVAVWMIAIPFVVEPACVIFWRMNI